MAEVFVYGEIGVDNIIRVPHLPAPELAAFPTSDTYHVGGAAANTAVNLAAWGVHTRLSGNAIGEDDQGKRLRQWLGAHPSLDLSCLESYLGLATPFCRILVRPDGERAILVFGYPQTPKTPLTPAMLDGARCLALDLYGGPERLEAARVARAAGVVTVVGDVIWPDHPILPFADIATNSGAFIRQEFPGVDPAVHARELQRLSGGIVVTTDGANPVQVIDRDGAQFWLQPPPVDAVDATGAGDAFKAGLIYGLLQGWPLHRAVRWAVATGALKVQTLGASSHPPTVENIVEMVKKVSDQSSAISAH
jgi:sugar/nucleoside kinase (ribokinase family)